MKHPKCHPKADHPELILADAIGVIVREMHSSDKPPGFSFRSLWDALYILIHAQATAHTCVDWPDLPCALPRGHEEAKGKWVL